MPLDLKTALETEDERAKQMQDLQREVELRKMREGLQEFILRMLQDASNLKVIVPNQT